MSVFFGERALTFGDNRGFRVFGISFFFVAGGFWDSVGRGGTVGVFDSISNKFQVRRVRASDPKKPENMLRPTYNTIS